MVRRCLLLVVVAAATLVSACGASSTDTVGGAVEVAVDGLAGADAAACDLERRVLADASELYLALNGSLPPTLDALVEAQFVSEPSALFEINADGAIVPAPGSPCV
jgi:hypothetical protein